MFVMLRLSALISAFVFVSLGNLCSVHLCITCAGSFIHKWAGIIERERETAVKMMIYLIILC